LLTPGIENIGVQIEQPFHIIAFGSFCRSVQRDVMDMVAMSGKAGSASNVPQGFGGDGSSGSGPVVIGLTRRACPSQPAQMAPAAREVFKAITDVAVDGKL
jgi:hypothetical protein